MSALSLPTVICSCALSLAVSVTSLRASSSSWSYRCFMENTCRQTDQAVRETQGKLRHTCRQTNHAQSGKRNDNYVTPAVRRIRHSRANAITITSHLQSDGSGTVGQTQLQLRHTCRQTDQAQSGKRKDNYVTPAGRRIRHSQANARTITSHLQADGSGTVRQTQGQLHHIN